MEGGASGFFRWTREVADSDHVQMTNFEEGLGRVMYVVGALEYERPFLGHCTGSLLSTLAGQYAVFRAL